MPKLTSLKEDGPVKPLVIPTGIEGSDLHIDYQPSQLDVGGQLEAGAAPTQVAQVSAVMEQLAVAIIKWDLEDDDGAVLPITIENLHALPAPIAAALMEGVANDQRPPTKSAGSFGGG